jgi:dephospho-CoA kinase
VSKLDSGMPDMGALSVAVTGGIGAGKSTVAAVLGGRGAVIIDSDQLAREVVRPGSAGLAAVAAEFGTRVMAADGSLDRAALAEIVFADPAARDRLEGITHPLVRALFGERWALAPPDGICLNDIPLIRSIGDAARYHLVVGVGIEDTDLRVRRLVDRGHSEVDARARIDAQISDQQRRRLCDVWIDNSGSPAELTSVLDRLWDRIHAFADNRRADRTVPRAGPVLIDPDPRWAELGTLLAARVSLATGGARTDHIGSTAVPGLPAKDVIDLQLTVADMDEADALRDPLAAAGFPRTLGDWRDTPHPSDSDPAGWQKRVHGNADPDRKVNLHLRVRDSPGWRWALLFPAWLRADPGVLADYLAVKRHAAGELTDLRIADYAAAKEPWMARAYPRGQQWADRTGWTPGPG